MIKSLLFAFSLITLVNSSNPTDNAILDLQKKIISELSGHQALSNGHIIASRSTKQERQIASEYLLELIHTVGLKPESQEYNLPNVNPLVDLLFDPFKGVNVYTTLAAINQSDEFIVIGGHYDTERHCPGAIDNAAGVAICTGVVKMLSKLETRNINVIVAFFDQEEEDLCGSQAFAKMLKAKNLKIHSVHTLDAMGWDRDGDKAVELELPTDYLKELYHIAGEKLGIPIHTTSINSTDHHSFRELGYNAIGLTDELVNGDYAPYKDTPKDTYDTVNFDYIASSTRLVYEVVKELVQQ